jgi:hypothetical protein
VSQEPRAKTVYRRILQLYNGYSPLHTNSASTSASPRTRHGTPGRGFGGLMPMTWFSRLGSGLWDAVPAWPSFGLEGGRSYQVRGWLREQRRRVWGWERYGGRQLGQQCLRVLCSQHETEALVQAA